jgi:hypothetical protein
MNQPIDRRNFLKGVVASAGVAGIGGARPAVAGPNGAPGIATGTWANRRIDGTKKPYTRPNVIIVRFGGGVRRQESIDPKHTHSPFLCHELTKRGTLFPKMEIVTQPGIETSHGQGTLYILTGKYDEYKDVNDKFLGARFEAKVPTVFEYLRKDYDIASHETLIVNGEDRIDEEFYTFSNHHLFGVQYRSEVLSLYRFKTHLLRRQLAEGKWSGKELHAKQADLHKMESLDYRVTDRADQGDKITQFWDRWRGYYGETGLVNPRGDRLLTELTVRAIRELRPKLLMVNYNDPDYVHWGNMSHYTRGVSIIDEGIERLVATVDADDEYRDNTVFVIVPDCGRDSNPFAPVPCQHHFGSRSSHEIFALLFGPGIARGQVVDRPVDQIDLAATVGQIMGFNAECADGSPLEEAIA